MIASIRYVGWKDEGWRVAAGLGKDKDGQGNSATDESRLDRGTGGGHVGSIVVVVVDGLRVGGGSTGRVVVGNGLDFDSGITEGWQAGGQSDGLESTNDTGVMGGAKILPSVLVVCALEDDEGLLLGVGKVDIKGGDVVDIVLGKVNVVVDDTEEAFLSDLVGKLGGSIGKHDVLEVATEGFLEVHFSGGQFRVNYVLGQGVQCIVMNGIETETDDMVLAEGCLAVGEHGVVCEQGAWDKEGDLKLPVDGL